MGVAVEDVEVVDDVRGGARSGSSWEEITDVEVKDCGDREELRVVEKFVGMGRWWVGVVGKRVSCSSWSV